MAATLKSLLPKDGPEDGLDLSIVGVVAEDSEQIPEGHPYLLECVLIEKRVISWRPVSSSSWITSTRSG